MNAVSPNSGAQRRVVVSRLRRIAIRLSSGTPLGRDDCEFLASSLGAFLSCENVTTLDQAFGLRSRGGASVQTMLRIDERDRLLRHLVREHATWSLLPASTAAKKLRREFDLYEAGRWKRERRAALAPSTEPQATFWRLLRSEVRMPQQKRLCQILELEINYPV